MGWLQKIWGKSASGVPSYDFLQAGDAMDLRDSVAPLDLIQHNRGYVYACDNIITRYLSSVPIHPYVYAKDKTITKTKKIGKALKQQMLATASVSRRFRDTKALEIVEIVDEHPIQDFLNKPATNMSWTSWLALSTSYLNLMGNCLYQIVETDDGTKLDILPWEWIQVQYTTKGIQSFAYQSPFADARTFKPDEVIHLKAYAAGSSLVGKGRLEACIQSAALMGYMSGFQRAIAKNLGVPGAIVTVENKQTMTPEQCQKLASEFRQKFSGMKSGRPMITTAIGGGSVTVKPWDGMTIQDARLSEARRDCRKEISAAFGVPEDMIDTSNSNRASSATAIDSFLQFSIYPYLTQILEQLNTVFVEPTFDSDMFLFFDKTEASPVDQSALATRVTGLVQSGIISKDEARLMLGMQTEGTDNEE